eukprot:CAMPEP_0175847342 /NCGR_PEP_ID=MMETSP0107_2-20121207/23302_1 /TAXON_ID=195067 ORGANISM="Goniomonas pacifica, Strain CCMP1869" /NCGR_SAMPLE_ID=MMETSP0107_2 /ASSEMBLY_ACC=CAM_ASM_000203 /LENGTH=37 /DNA_ID= /DNA_START= /DNA_END= /DNA_ORIENTATION=
MERVMGTGVGWVRQGAHRWQCLPQFVALEFAQLTPGV